MYSLKYQPNNRIGASLCLSDGCHMLGKMHERDLPGILSPVTVCKAKTEEARLSEKGAGCSLI